MLWLEVVVAAAVLVGLALLVSRGAGGIEEVDVDTADLGLPADRLLHADDVARLRFRTISGLWGGLRGYRFADVDAAMAKVEEALRAHEGRVQSPAPTRRAAPPDRQ